MTDSSQPEPFLIARGSDGEIGITHSPSQGEPLAEVTLNAMGWVIRDLGGSIPVLVDGNPVFGLVSLQPQSTIEVGSWSWTPPSEEHAYAKGVSICLEAVTKTVQTGLRGKRIELLGHVSLSVKAGEFIGILGPSGAGKSTLLKLMNGEQAASQGRVLLDERPAEEFLAEHRSRLAYLPQDPIVHEPLTPRCALSYLARLQGVDSTSLVAAMLDRVAVGDRADTPIRNLSGGERKRVALAACLLADPGAIFLDEATSGLDPSLEKDMMGMFRSIADEGKTVVCITHFPQNVSLCDRLIVMAKGRVHFFGTPREAQTFYKVDYIEDIYPILAQADTSGADAGKSFRNSHGPNASISGGKQKDSHFSARPAAIPELAQTAILLTRYGQLLACDPGNVVLLILQAPVIALLIGAIFGNIAVDYSEQHAADWKQVAFLLIMSVIWCAGTNGVREIVKERAIYLHERRYGISPRAYLFSKFIPLGLVGIVQAISLLGVLGAQTHFAGNWLVHGIVLALVALAGTALGLLISARVRTSESAMTILPVVLISQAVLSGGLARLTGLAKYVAEGSAPAFWGLCGLKDTLPSALLDATFVSVPGEYQPPILGRGPSVWVNIVALCLQTLVLLWIGAVCLKRIERRGAQKGGDNN